MAQRENGFFDVFHSRISFFAFLVTPIRIVFKVGQIGNFLGVWRIFASSVLGVNRGEVKTVVFVDFLFDTGEQRVGGIVRSVKKAFLRPSSSSRNHVCPAIFVHARSVGCHGSVAVVGIGSQKRNSGSGSVNRGSCGDVLCSGDSSKSVIGWGRTIGELLISGGVIQSAPVAVLWSSIGHAIHRNSIYQNTGIFIVDSANTKSGLSKIVGRCL